MIENGDEKSLDLNVFILKKEYWRVAKEKPEENGAENKKKDILRNILIGSTNLIPLAGGTLSFFLDKYLPSVVEERRNAFLQKVEEDLENIPIHTIQSACDDPEYASIVLKVFKHALEDFRMEKVTAFRNILIHATTDGDTPL